MNLNIFLVLLFLSVSVGAQQSVVEEEVVVTGARAAAEDLPGITLKRAGDFLLLQVRVTNDTRDKKGRANEIYKTIKNAISIAKKDSAITMSVLQGSLVIPLTADNYQIELSDGERQDTSEALITIKTKISSNVANPTKLVEKLKQFAKSVPVEGRVEVIALADVDVSVVNPNQYRYEILDLVSKDINYITEKLGEDYRVVLEGINRPVQWSRSGPLHLSLYVPYSYTVIPKNVTTIFPEGY